MRNKQITKELLEKSNYWKYNEKQSKLMTGGLGEDVFVFDSKDRLISKYDQRWKYHVTIMNVSNNPEYPWNVHIDNQDFDSLAGFEVKDLDHLNQMVMGYNIHVSQDMTISYLEPSWIGDVLMARHNLYVIKHYIRHTQAYPPELSWKEWRKIVGHIIFSLECIGDTEWMMDVHDWFIKKYPNDKREHWEKFYDRIEEGMMLFGKYFGHFSW